jgi:transcription initiation factor TFIIIB Brf1 subunit/transcription initiation factor TFIIB
LAKTVAGRFFLPKTIAQNAVQVAKKLLPIREECHATIPAISAYSLLYACRSAGISRVGFRDVLKAYSEAGHKVSKSQLLRIGRGSSLPLPAAKPEDMTKRAVATLQSNPKVLSRLGKANLDQGKYFASLLEAARAAAGASTGLGGFSPRTVAAASVYLSGRKLGPKAITQKDVAESLGIAEYTVREFCGKFRSQEAR